MPKSTGDDWMSVPDACYFPGIVNRTLYSLIDTGQVPAFKFGRVILSRRTDVVAFLEGQRIEPGTLRHLSHPKE